MVVVAVAALLLSTSSGSRLAGYVMVLDDSSMMSHDQLSGVIVAPSWYSVTKSLGKHLRGMVA